MKELGFLNIESQVRYRRYYPERESMAHIVGFTDIQDKGQDGMELSNDELLSGKDGQKHVVIDRLEKIAMI
jgi:cell division protein FtsI (penicillin-binding protein 3)